MTDAIISNPKAISVIVMDANGEESLPFVIVAPTWREVANLLEGDIADLDDGEVMEVRKTTP